MALTKAITLAKSQPLNYLAVMGEVERLGALIGSNNSHQVFNEWLHRCTAEQIIKCKDQLAASNNEDARTQGVLSLFGHIMDPLDLIHDQA